MDAEHVRAVAKALEEMGGFITGLGLAFEDFGPEGECYRMSIGERHTGAPSVAHGGSVMALMDTALGLHALAIAATRGGATSTIEMKVNSLRPAPAGVELRTRTEVQVTGHSWVVVSGQAVDTEAGHRVAYAVGTFNIYTRGPIAAQLRAALA